MAEIGDKVFTTDMIQLIKDAVKAELGTNAYVNRYLAEVTAVDTTTSAVSVKLSGSDSVSDSFRARGIQLPSVGEQVVACIDGQDRWIESVIRPTTSTPYVTFATAAAVPTGAVVAWLTGTAPTGWLFCDGTSYAYNTYPALGALLGGSAGGNFSVPDMKDRFLAGKSATAGNYSNTTGTLSPSSAITSHTHTSTHGHTFTGSAHAHSVDVPSHDHGINGATESTSHSHTLPNVAETVPGSAFTVTFPRGTSSNITVASSSHTHAVSADSWGTGTSGGHVHNAGTLNPTATDIPAFNSANATQDGTVEEDSTETGVSSWTTANSTPKSTLVNFIIKT
jgi:microcystin-dependent protein